ncbi:MAG: thymidine phosphorylase [Candidatus Micrarchaeia archaeon]
MPDGEIKLRVKIFDVEQGQNEVVISEELAKERIIEVGDRLHLRANGKTAVALVDHSQKYLEKDEIALFDEVVCVLEARDKDVVFVRKEQRPSSLDYIRKKLDGQSLSKQEISEVFSDLMQEKFSQAELVAFVSAVYVHGVNNDEIVALTDSIYRSGEYLKFDSGKKVVSEHSIGGVAGDRVSMLIVPLLGSFGIIVPKTATRAISSASGTADAMEVFCRVDLSKKEVEKAVKKVGCCLVWGGGVNMATADDKLIRVRHPLRLDPPGLLLSSILAKKKAEGARFVLLDLPYGQGAKLETLKDARALAKEFKELGSKLDLEIMSIVTDGSVPAMPFIGPALEARAVLQVLQGIGPEPLAEKASVMAGLILEKTGHARKGAGYELAKKQLKSGKALEKFREMVKAQGGNPDVAPEDIKIGKLRYIVKAPFDGKVAHVDNKSIFKAARALGAPADKASGIILRASKGQRVKKGQVLFELVSNSQSAIDYTVSRKKEYSIVQLKKIIVDVI